MQSALAIHGNNLKEYELKYGIPLDQQRRQTSPFMMILPTIDGQKNFTDQKNLGKNMVGMLRSKEPKIVDMKELSFSFNNKTLNGLEDYLHFEFKKQRIKNNHLNIDQLNEIKIPLYESFMIMPQKVMTGVECGMELNNGGTPIFLTYTSNLMGTHTAFCLQDMLYGSFGNSLVFKSVKNQDKFENKIKSTPVGTQSKSSITRGTFLTVSGRLSTNETDSILNRNEKEDQIQEDLNTLQNLINSNEEKKKLLKHENDKLRVLNVALKYYQRKSQINEESSVRSRGMISKGGNNEENQNNNLGDFKSLYKDYKTNNRNWSRTNQPGQINNNDGYRSRSYQPNNDNDQSVMRSRGGFRSRSMVSKGSNNKYSINNKTETDSEDSSDDQFISRSMTISKKKKYNNSINKKDINEDLTSDDSRDEGYPIEVQKENSSDHSSEEESNEKNVREEVKIINGSIVQGDSIVLERLRDPRALKNSLPVSKSTNQIIPLHFTHDMVGSQVNLIIIKKVPISKEELESIIQTASKKQEMV